MFNYLMLIISVLDYLEVQRGDATYRHVNMLSAASLFSAKMGSFARRAMTICRAGSRPMRVSA